MRKLNEVNQVTVSLNKQCEGEMKRCDNHYNKYCGVCNNK